MITERQAIKALDRGDYFMLENNTYQVRINSGDKILLEQLTPTHGFIWWDIETQKNKYVEIIKSSV